MNAHSVPTRSFYKPAEPLRADGAAMAWLAGSGAVGILLAAFSMVNFAVGVDGVVAALERPPAAVVQTAAPTPERVTATNVPATGTAPLTRGPARGKA